MKNAFVSIFLTLLLTSTLYLPSAFAQDYTQLSLPEGAKARLGKGWISGNIAYSPDGTRLAVASSIGIWIYDAQTGEELDLLTGPTSGVSSVSFSSGWRHNRIGGWKPYLGDWGPHHPFMGCWDWKNHPHLIKTTYGSGHKRLVQSRWKHNRIGELGRHHPSVGCWDWKLHPHPIGTYGSGQ